MISPALGRIRKGWSNANPLSWYFGSGRLTDSPAKTDALALVDEVERLREELGILTISLDAEVAADLESRRQFVEARRELAELKGRVYKTCGWHGPSCDCLAYPDLACSKFPNQSGCIWTPLPVPKAGDAQ